MVLKETYSVSLGEHGEVALPEELRHELGIEPGDVLVVRIKDGEMRIVSARELVRRARGMFAHLAPGRSLVDELIAERREEARREEEEGS